MHLHEQAKRQTVYVCRSDNGEHRFTPNGLPVPEDKAYNVVLRRCGEHPDLDARIKAKNPMKQSKGK